MSNLIDDTENIVILAVVLALLLGAVLVFYAISNRSKNGSLVGPDGLIQPGEWGGLGDVSGAGAWNPFANDSQDTDAGLGDWTARWWQTLFGSNDDEPSSDADPNYVPPSQTPGQVQTEVAGTAGQVDQWLQTLTGSPENLPFF